MASFRALLFCFQGENKSNFPRAGCTTGSKVKVGHILAHTEQSARGIMREAGALARVLGEGLAAALGRAEAGVNEPG